MTRPGSPLRGVIPALAGSLVLFAFATAQAAPPDDFYRIDTGATGAIGVAPGAADDAASGGSACTLRDALAIVTAGTTVGPVNGCDITAVGAPDPTLPVYVVALPSGGYTYTLVVDFGQDLDIRFNTVFIQGDTADNSIIQAAATPGTAFGRVLTTFQATVELSNLTIRHGFHQPAFLFDGGGISNRLGSLTLDAARVEDNGNRGRGGGIYHDSGELRLQNGSLVRRNAPTQAGAGSDGGGIYSRGTLLSPSTVIVDASSVRENVVSEGGEGGGIANAGVSTVIVRNGGRVEENVVSGVLSGFNAGGGISSSGAEALVLIDEGGVVAGNRATGGSLAGRGGGIHNGFFGTVRVENGGSVEGNVAGRGSGIYNDFGGIVRIERGSLTGNGVDPIEFDSIEGGGIYNTAELQIVDSEISDNAAEQFSGGGLLNTGANAVATIEGSTFARNRSGGFAFGSGGAIQNLLGGRVTVSDTVLEENEADLGGAVSSYSAGSLLTLAGTTVRSNRAFSGAGLYNVDGSRLELTDSALDSNVASGFGGGLLNDGTGAVAVIDGTHVVANEAGTGGGIANVEEARVELSGGSIGGNLATLDGGGIHNDGFGTTLLLTGTAIEDNVAIRSGGGIENSRGAEVQIVQSSLAGNSAGTDGGAIRNDQGFGFGLAVNVVSLTDSVLQGNTAGEGGGAISSESAFESTSRVELSNTLVGGDGAGEGNSAQVGGAFHLVANAESGANELALHEGTRVVRNTATGAGGAIHSIAEFRGPVSVVVSDAEIVENEAGGSGGALYSVVDSGASIDVDVDRSRLLGNVAGEQGGGLFVDSRFDFGLVGTSAIDIADSTLSANTAALEGGAAYQTQTGGVSSLVVDDAILADNAASDGGALYHAEGTARINASCIQRNGDVAVVNAGGGVQDATGNWWGASDGPGPVGPGSGDTVSAGVDFAGFATAPFADCGVAIDIRPYSRHNKVVLWSHGLVKVALLGSAAFDVDDVDVHSLDFEGASPFRRLKYKDVDDDGFVDLITSYRSSHTDIEFDQTEACLSGQTLGGESFEGCDAITPVLPWWARWWKPWHSHPRHDHRCRHGR